MQAAGELARGVALLARSYPSGSATCWAAACSTGNRLAAILRNNPCGCFPARSIPQPITLGQLFQHRLGLFQVERVETFSEPAVDGREDVVGLGAPTLITPEPREARRGAKLK